MIAAALALLVQAAPWNQWQGPERNGHTPQPSGTWPPGKLWERRLGESDSSPIIRDGAVYVTTLKGNRTEVHCVDARTGKTRWTGTTPGGRYGRHADGDKNSYCGPVSTPACDGERLFTVSIDGDLRCWDARTGEGRWGFNLYARYRMGKRKHNRDYGYATSPLLLRDHVVVEVGGIEGAVMKFDKRSGKKADAWGSGQVGHSSGPAGPDGRVFFGLDRLWIGDLGIPWKTDFACNIGMPAVAGDRVICSSAYDVSRTRCFVKGREAWSVKTHDKVRSLVIHERAGIVILPGAGTVLDLKDGSPRWRFRRSTNVIVTGDDRLIAFGDSIRLLDLQGEMISEVRGIRQGWPGGAFGEGFLVFKNRDTVVCYSVGGRR